MPYVSERSGTYTREQADSGTIRFIDVPGTSGPVPNTVFANMTVSGLTPSDPNITIQMYPSGAFTQGVDESGNIGISTTFTPDPDDPRIWYSVWSGGVAMNFPDGLEGQEFRTVVNSEEIVNIDWVFQIGGPAPDTDFPLPLLDAPENLDVEDVQFNEETETGSAVMTFDYNGDEEPTGFVTEYQDGSDWFPDGNVLFDPDETHYEIPTYVFDSPISFNMRVRAYKIDPDGDDLISPPSSTVLVEWTGDEPAMVFTGGQTGGFIDMGGVATIVLAADPSGIYTLVPGKTNDTLYNRDVTPVGTTDVKIPDPFIRTGFLE